MILFLDINKQKISLYGKEGMVEIPFKNAEELSKHTKNNDFLYITNAAVANAEEVVGLIRQMGVYVEKVKPEKFTYIHVANEGVIPINDELRFRGKYDAHPLTPELIQTIKETPLLKKLLEEGQLELISTSRRRELEEERKRKEDERYGAILIDGDVKEFMEGRDKQPGSDAIVIDLEKAGPAVEEGNINTMSELLVEIDGFEGQ